MTSRTTDEDIRETRKNLNLRLDAESTMWRQRSRNTWLVSGDQNTSFFYAKTSHRFQRNTIQGSCDEDGSWQESDEAMKRIALDYFNSIFKSNRPTDLIEVVETIQLVVSRSMNRALLIEFRAEEVTKALKQMYPKKASVPDGIPHFFYQHYWSIVGNCVTLTVLDFLNHGIIPPKFNETHIIFIPKIKNPTKITHYRPTGLSNVVSRLASKVLANRLKLLFPKIISENQSAFMNNQLITDNVLVAFETMHHISHTQKKKKKSGNVGEMAFKLDMSKAYDRVKWGCVEKIMLKMGFHTHWVEIMIRCVQFVTYAVKINGKP